MFDKFLKFLGVKDDTYVPDWNLQEDFLFGAPPEYNNKLSASSSYSSTARDPADIAKGCQCVDCNRPSMFTIITTEEIETKIPFASGSRLRGEQRLPTYHWYQLCDRHFEVITVAPKMIMGPAVFDNSWLKELKGGKNGQSVR